MCDGFLLYARAEFTRLFATVVVSVVAIAIAIAIAMERTSQRAVDRESIVPPCLSWYSKLLTTGQAALLIRWPRGGITRFGQFTDVGKYGMPRTYPFRTTSHRASRKDDPADETFKIVAIALDRGTTKTSRRVPSRIFLGSILFFYNTKLSNIYIYIYSRLRHFRYRIKIVIFFDRFSALNTLPTITKNYFYRRKNNSDSIKISNTQTRLLCFLKTAVKKMERIV